MLQIGHRTISVVRYIVICNLIYELDLTERDYRLDACYLLFCLIIKLNLLAK